MARPKKDGLDYFPFDVDFDTNEKTEAINGEFGAKGTLIFIYLLLAIYRKGYFLQWDELVKNQLANRVPGATGELVEQVVKRLISYGTFNEALFTSDNVLTSQRIQATYLDATKRRKNDKPSLYWINDGINVTSSGVNVDINPQSKVKENKVNKTKTNKNQQKKSSVVAHDTSAFKLWENLWGFPNAIALETLVEWIHEFGDELVSFAIRYAAKRDVKNKGAVNYLTKVLEGYKQKGITTVDEAQAALDKHQQVIASNRSVPNFNKPIEPEPDWFKQQQEQPQTAKPEPNSNPESNSDLAAMFAELEQAKNESKSNSEQKSQ
ncbi:Lin1244/Lin1753 domain-containing protein [Agrilactobacillus fermenti]|uniref:Lin1244/Lin1753 domain-containing protein n=1 Tax=Agrilactobacillus fermenti TaxID=2586909 RepID=UPI003A5C55AD